MGLAGVIGVFTTGTYAVTRTVAATYGTDGRLIAGSTSVINMDASIQPMSGRELQALPEGAHGREVRKMFSKSELSTRTPGNDPDLVMYKSESWEVLSVSAWEAFGLGSGGDHWEAIIARIATP